MHPFLSLQRITRGAVIASIAPHNHMLEFVSIAEFCSVILPFMRPKTIIALVFVTSVSSGYFNPFEYAYFMDKKLVTLEIVFLSLVFIYLHTPCLWEIAY